MAKSPGRTTREAVATAADRSANCSKQATGDLTHNPDLHDEGVADEVAGKTQDAVGRVKRKVGEAIEDVGNAIKKSALIATSRRCLGEGQRLI